MKGGLSNETVLLFFIAIVKKLADGKNTILH